MLAGLGYAIGETIFDPLQNVNLILCTANDQPSVEIIFPAKDPGAVDGLLAQHPKGLVYHLCFTTGDLEKSLAAIEAANLHAFCVAPPKPAVVFQMRSVSFYLVNGFGLVEILQD